MSRITIRSTLLLTFMGAACFAMLGAPAQAAILTYNESDAATSRGDGPYTVGYLFEVGSTPIVINHLGVQDVDDTLDTRDPDGADGLTGFADDDGFVTGGNIFVGLWDSTGSTLLASTTVSDSDIVIDSWRYAPMTFVNGGGTSYTLAANTQYLLGAYVGSGIEFFLEEFNDTTSAFGEGSGVTVRQSRYLNGNGAPILIGGSLNEATTRLRWGTPNAILIPEPRSIAIASIALIGIAILGWRQRRVR